MDSSVFISISTPWWLDSFSRPDGVRSLSLSLSPSYPVFFLFLVALWTRVARTAVGSSSLYGRWRDRNDWTCQCLAWLTPAVPVTWLTNRFTFPRLSSLFLARFVSEHDAFLPAIVGKIREKSVAILLLLFSPFLFFFSFRIVKKNPWGRKRRGVAQLGWVGRAVFFHMIFEKRKGRSKRAGPSKLVQFNYRGLWPRDWEDISSV